MPSVRRTLTAPRSLAVCGLLLAVAACRLRDDAGKSGRASRPNPKRILEAREARQQAKKHNAEHDQRSEKR